MARTRNARTRLMLVGGALVAVLAVSSAVAWLLVFHPHGAGRLASQLQGEASSLTEPGPAGNEVVAVDSASDGIPISPLIYGVAGAEPDTVQQLGATLDRSGGNPASTYNWANGHAWNASRDWQFRNGSYSQSGSAADTFVTGSLGAGATPLLTVPTLGWVARDDDNATMSTGVPGQGGSPVGPGSSAISGYDPSANRAAVYVPSYARKNAPFVDQPPANAPAVYQDEWVHHLVSRFGPGGVRYYAMDNEPDLWSSTHTDVHPVRMGYDDMLANFEQYATMVKEEAPQASVLGPDVSGWESYFYSDLDRGGDSYATHADQKAHGSQPFLPWWLQQVAAADAKRGSRSLDLLDVHYYPQGQGVHSAAADPDTQQRRIRSVRSLWDPTYQDESWIGTNVMLIPRLKQWIAQDYPGTGLAISEYSFGGEQDASGAVAEAEALGVFGREGVDLAAYWTFPPPNSPAGAAFRLYRNFDGHGATFGDRSVRATSGSSQLAAFASKHADTGEVDVVLANESLSATTSVSLSLSGPLPRSATAFVVAAGSGTIQRVQLASPLSPVNLPPLTIAVVRLSPR